MSNRLTTQEILAAARRLDSKAPGERRSCDESVEGASSWPQISLGAVKPSGVPGMEDFGLPPEELQRRLDEFGAQREKREDDDRREGLDGFSAVGVNSTAPPVAHAQVAASKAELPPASPRPPITVGDILVVIAVFLPMLGFISFLTWFLFTDPKYFLYQCLVFVGLIIAEKIWKIADGE